MNLFCCHYCNRREVRIQLAPFMVTVVIAVTIKLIATLLCPWKHKSLCGETGWTSGVTSPLLFHSSTEIKTESCLTLS